MRRGAWFRRWRSEDVADGREVSVEGRSFRVRGRIQNLWKRRLGDQHSNERAQAGTRPGAGPPSHGLF
jgi:hypothetical protein